MSVSSNSPQHLGTVLDKLMEQFGYRDRIDEARAVESWEELAGPAITRVTESVWVKNGCLFVKVNSAAWRHQLHLQRESWRERINDHLGREVVDEVVFR